MKKSNKKDFPFKSFSGFAITETKKKGETVIIGFQFNEDDKQSESSKLTMIQHVLDDFGYPEVIRRIKENSDRTSFPLRNIHIMMFSDETKNRIFLNDEVKIKARVKSTRKLSPKEEVRVGDIDKILSLHPQEKVDKNAANILLMKLKTKWYFAADLIYDRDKVGKRFELSNDFFKIGSTAFDNEYWGPFIDTLYSVTELSIQSILLLMFYREYSIKQSHEKTLELFKGYCERGNTPKKFYEHYKTLYSLRKKARYLEGTQGKKFVIKKQLAQKYLKTTKELMDFTNLWIKRTDSFRKLKAGQYIAVGN